MATIAMIGNRKGRLLRAESDARREVTTEAHTTMESRAHFGARRDIPISPGDRYSPGIQHIEREQRRRKMTLTPRPERGPIGRECARSQTLYLKTR